MPPRLYNETINISAGENNVQDFQEDQKASKQFDDEVKVAFSKINNNDYIDI